MTFLAKPVAIMTALALGLVALTAKPATAQSNDNKAAVVIALSSIEEQLKDVNYLSDAAGFGRLGGMIINSQADEYLAGVDKTKPIGIFVHIQEDNPEVPIIVGAVPVTDYDEVLDTLSQLGDLDDSGDVDIIAMGNGEELFMYEQKGHVIFSNNKDALAWAPSDIGKTLGDLPKNYNFAAKVFGQRIPKSLRDQAIDAMREGFERQLEESGADGNDLEEKSMQLQMAQMESLINETEVFTFGFAANKEKKSIYFDVEMIGTKDSSLAKQAQAQKDAPKSRFSGFLLDGAMINGGGTSKLAKSDIENYKGLLSGLKEQVKDEMDLEGASEREAEAVKGFVDTVFEVLEDTLDGGTSDAGMVIMGGESPSMAVGFHAVNASKLDRKLRDLAEVAKDSGELEVKLNAEKLGNVSLHRARIAVPDGEEEMQAMFGDHLDVYVGVGDNTVYLAAGDDCFSLLKKCVNRSDSSSSKNVAGEMNIYLSKVFELISSVEAEESMEQMAEVLKEAGNDRFSIQSKNVENGVNFRVEIQDGILKLISVAAEQFGGAFGGF